MDLDLLMHNISLLKRRLRPDCKFMAVVKADAYGHGAVPIARAALTAGADYLGVSSAQEGAELREAGIQAPILVLGAPLSMPLIVQHELEQTVFNCENLELLQHVCAQFNKTIKVHIKIDSGMNRIGLKTEAELRRMLEYLSSCPNLELKALLTHFAVSEIQDKSFSNAQFNRFMELVDVARSMGFSPMLHACNSGAALDMMDQMQLDMVRVGIAMYGYSPGAGCGEWASLQPIMTLRTVIVQIKQIEQGDTVSYGRNYCASEQRKIATLPIGYGDGYKRTMSNRAFALVHGRRVPIAGAICMDQCMIDITDVPGVKVGDEVVLFGRQGNETITANELANWADTISYEILLSLTGRVPRVYTGAGETN
ncbi:alanine racemase [Eubacteriales bacterium OttesenSCG-928-K08]|nr:alanine racemase [Eubacteriales bacterium OttesenSCG-928-K08]